MIAITNQYKPDATILAALVKISLPSSPMALSKMTALQISNDKSGQHLTADEMDKFCFIINNLFMDRPDFVWIETFLLELWTV